MGAVILHEVGMRDGLQMERQTVPTERKLQWVAGLVESGVDVIQIGAFVRPDKVPQMADTDELFRALAGASRGPARATLSALVLNRKGLERGIRCGGELFCMGVSASETHSRKNTGMSTEEAISEVLSTAHDATAAGARIQLSVQSAFGCGYEGRVAPERVLEIVRRFLEAGFRSISLADTAGHAVPDQVQRLYESLLALDPSMECACHFHNTYGLAMANCVAAMKAGVRSFESSVAGLGGCPFTRIAGGNLCTEDFVQMLQLTGIRRDVDLSRIIEVARSIAGFFKRDLPGMVYKVGRLAAGGIGEAPQQTAVPSTAARP